MPPAIPPACWKARQNLQQKILEHHLIVICTYPLGSACEYVANRLVVLLGPDVNLNINSTIRLSADNGIVEQQSGQRVHQVWVLLSSFPVEGINGKPAFLDQYSTLHSWHYILYCTNKTVKAMLLLIVSSKYGYFLAWDSAPSYCKF